MAMRFTTAYHAVNLLRNGNFELTRTVDANTVPEFWTITGAAADELGNSETITSYKIFQDQPLDGASDNYLQLIMQDTATVLLEQDVRQSATFDFPQPLAPDTRRSLESGYQNDSDILLPRGNYTIGVAIQATQGDVAVSVIAKNGDTVLPLTFQDGGQTQTAAQSSEYTRLSFAFTADTTMTSIGLQFTRTPGTGLVNVKLALLSMTQGTYSTLPALPDPFTSCFPAGAIILSMGDTCPPGFDELGDGDLSALPEWAQTNSDAHGRKGNYPRSAAAQSGTELHTSTPNFTVFNGEEVDFPSYTNKEVVENDQNIDVDYVNPPADQLLAHEHAISSAGTRPVSWPFRLCKRL